MFVVGDAEFRSLESAAFDQSAKWDIVCFVLLFEDGRRVNATPGSWHLLAPYLSNPDLTFVFHHPMTAELPCLRQLKLPWPQKWVDTELMARTIDIAQTGFLQGRYKLLHCLERRGLRCRSDIEKSAMQQFIANEELSPRDREQILEYCYDDCKDTLRLFQSLRCDFDKLSSRMQRLYVDLLQPHLFRVSEIASRGLMFDWDSYSQILNAQEDLLVGMQRRMQQQGFVGRFSHPYERLTSAAQNLNVQHTLENFGLYDLINSLPVYKQDGLRLPWRQRRSLKNLFKKPPKAAPAFIHSASRYHELLNLVSTDWLNFVDMDGKIRPNVSFPGSSSFRVMQFRCHPLRLPKFARPLVHASEGNVLHEYDFMGQEIPLAASTYGDERLLGTYNTHNSDLYAAIGAEMGEFPRGALSNWKEYRGLRDNCKVAILAISYGGAIAALMQNLHCSYERAQEVYRNFWEAFWQLRDGRVRYHELCRRSGVALNRIGLERKFKEVRFTRKGPIDQTLSYLNYPIQSSGSAVLMLILQEMPSWVRVVLTTHDGLIVEAPADAARDVDAAVLGAMGRAMKALFPDVRLRVDVQRGYRYFKDDPGTLHNFCEGLGLKLDAEIGWRAHE